MNHRDIAVLMDGIAPVLRGYVEKAFEPIGARILALEKRFAEIAEPRDGKDADPELVLRLVQETVAANPAPAGRDGKDADPEFVAALVDKAVAALEPAKDGEPGPAGESVTLEQLAPLVADVVAQEMAKLDLPVGPAGEKGEPGEPGKPVTVEDLAPLVSETVHKTVMDELWKVTCELPAGKDGEPGPPGEPGKSVTVEDLAPLVDEIVSRRVVQFPPAKDGLDGKDGAPGRDGRDGLPGVQGEKGLDGRNGVDGKDGLSIDDFDVKSIDDGRALEFSLKREGADAIVKQVALGTVLDRGVWREQAYAKGDGVTWGGSFFIAQRATAEADKPGNSDGWRLSVKKGRDGRDGKDGKNGVNGKDGSPGRDGRNGY